MVPPHMGLQIIKACHMASNNSFDRVTHLALKTEYLVVHFVLIDEFEETLQVGPRVFERLLLQGGSSLNVS